MTTLENVSSTGRKKTIVKKGQDGYGDIIYRVRLIEIIPTGIGFQERLIEMKSFTTEKKAINWAKKQF